MVRTTIYLSEEVHKSLKHLAVERSQTMADLLREAVERVYKEDLADLRVAQKAWKAHLRNPAKAVPARRYFSKHSRNV